MPLSREFQVVAVKRAEKGRGWVAMPGWSVADVMAGEVAGLVTTAQRHEADGSTSLLARLARERDA